MVHEPSLFENTLETVLVRSLKEPNKKKMQNLIFHFLCLELIQKNVLGGALPILLRITLPLAADQVPPTSQLYCRMDWTVGVMDGSDEGHRSFVTSSTLLSPAVIWYRCAAAHPLALSRVDLTCHFTALTTRLVRDSVREVC
jgi:hypothetical protein